MDIQPLLRRSRRYLILIAALLVGACRSSVYCPVTHFETQGIFLDAYLHLDENRQPDYLEVRRTDHGETYWKRSTTVLLKVYGAQTVDMKLDLAGVRFTLSTDSTAGAQDTTVVINVDQPLHDAVVLKLEGGSRPDGQP